MSKIISAGILLECDGEFLIGHPTELTGSTHGWGILKGKIDEGESLCTAAFREFYEESGVNLTLNSSVCYAPRPFYKYDVGGKKTVYVFWMVDVGLSSRVTKFHCPSMIVGTNKPEIDDYKWVDVDTAIDMVTESQKDLFRHVKTLTKHK